MFKVFSTRRIPEAGLAMLTGRADIHLRVWPKDRAPSRRELLREVRGMHALITLLTDRIDGEVLAAAGPQLKLVANYAVGYDNIDLAAAKAAGVTVANTPGALEDAVAEHAIALLFAVAKRIPEADQFVRRGKYEGWAPMLLLGTQLAGKTLGIVGLGRIGIAVAERAARGIKMKVVYNDVRRNEEFEKSVGATFVEREILLRESDAVSIHVPLLPATRHLINAEALRLMKPTAILINTSRGQVSDEDALVAALRSGTIGGAGIDVYEHEPKLARGLAKLPNVVLTPHTASATPEARDDMARLAAQAVLDMLVGKVPASKVA
jgi:lactate dehydrogenase-like 2-hydroxyacid dehydrogenase